MGPQRFWRELQAEAPRYAKLIPELPRLVHAALQRQQAADPELVQELLREQRRTNRLLQGLVYGGFGFVLGMLAMQVLTRIRLF
jgi:ubiquinone biosynthesis protein